MFTLFFLQDDIKDFYYTPDYKMFWVSFLDGMQRILLFTEDNQVAITAAQVRDCPSRNIFPFYYSLNQNINGGACCLFT